MRHRLSVVAASLKDDNAPAQQAAPQPAFTFQEVMIPVRDGVHLQTAILTPTDKTGPLPILFRRTPYGVPDGPLPTVPTSLRELARDGYIFVFQNLRGRFKSEGVFGLTSQVNLADSTSTNETTDAYDSIDWLVKHVPNNGNVGMFGVSYDGLTTALALLHPHPALKAMSEQASPVDQWMNDDDHRYGALRESYDFEYAVMEQADKNSNTHFEFETYDTFQWYLDLGPLSNINAKYLHGKGEKPNRQACTFQSGSNSWHNYAVWPPKEAPPTNLYLHADGTLSFTAPTAAESVKAYREYVSDPANPVPYRQRPISPTYPAGDWRTWEVADQRFVDGRPDVLSFVSAPLEHDITVTGPVAAALFASTSGTDSDFVVKLIDAYPDNAQKNSWPPEDGPKPGQYAQSLNGYELPIAMEVRRGRYLQSFETPHALASNQPIEWNVPLRDHDHVFLKGHRIMLQIQSTWFPLIDRNPQKFVPSIYKAVASDFIPATQRIYCSPAMPSHVVLPVVQ